MVAACVALLGTAGCRCSSDTRAPSAAARPSKDAVGLPAHATATDLPAPATATAVKDPLRMLGDAEWLLGRAATWLAPRFGAGLAPGRHGLASSRGVGVHDIVELTKDGIAVEWSGLGVRFERKGRECRLPWGAAVVDCPRVVVEETSLLLALAALSQPQTWSAGAWRVEALRPQGDDTAEIRLASPVFGVRVEAAVRSDGQVSRVVLAGIPALLIEGGRALNAGDQGTLRWEAPAEAPSAGYQALRIALSGSLTADVQGVVERAVRASGVLTRQDYVEFEIERSAQGLAWRAVMLPVAQSKPAPAATPGIVTLRPRTPETSGFATLDFKSGLGQVQSTFAALPFADGCHILRIILRDAGGSAQQPSLYTIRACAP